MGLYHFFGLCQALINNVNYCIKTKLKHLIYYTNNILTTSKKNDIIVHEIFIKVIT